jgi:hypothetical protein
LAHWLSALAGDPAIQRFRENSRGYWTTHGSMMAIFLVALLCDTVSTIRFMQELGVGAEWHPAVRLASAMFGPVAGPLIGALGKAIACICVTIYCRRYAGGIFLAATLIYLFAAWYNAWGMYLLV